MSHIVRQAGTIKNLRALKSAVEHLGGTMTEGHDYTYEGNSKGHDAEFVIRFPNADGHHYSPREIGVIPNKRDNTYALGMSGYTGGICRYVGEPLDENNQQVLAPKLMQAYQVFNIKETAEAQGHSVTIQELANGECRMTVAQPEYAQC